MNENEIITRLVRIETKQDAMIEKFSEQSVHNDKFYEFGTQLTTIEARLSTYRWVIHCAWAVITALGAVGGWAISLLSGRHGI